MNLPIDQDLFGSHAPPPPPKSPRQLPPDAEPGDDHPEPATEGADDPLLPPPDFRPFFTLVSDPNTAEHHHPTVHYLFSDDDPEILTAAALHSIESGDVGEPNEQEGDGGGRTEDAAEERVVIVDIAADGRSVANVASLSRAWQALRTEVGAAPSMGDASADGEGDGGSGRGLMLKVSGVEADGRRHAGQGGDLEGLVGRFGEVLEGLDGVIGREEGGGDLEGGEGRDRGS